MKDRRWFRIIFLLLFASKSLFCDEIAYVANLSDGTVSIIDVVTEGVTTLPTAAGAQGTAFTPDGTIAYVSNFSGASNNVSQIDVAMGMITHTIPVGSNPYGGAVSQDGSVVYIPNAGSNNVSIIDVASHAVVQTVPVGTDPVSVAFSPDGSLAYVANFTTNNISIINVSMQMVTDTIAVGTDPNSVAFSPDGSLACVANSTSNNVSLINTSTHAITNIPVGTTPFGAAFSLDGTVIYAANFGTNNVSVIDVATEMVIHTVAAGTNPYGIAFIPDQQVAYVTNNGSNNVSVLDVTDVTMPAPAGTISVGMGPQGVSTPVSIFNWIVDADGSWNTTTDWSPQLVPTNSSILSGNAKAQFLDVITAPKTVTIDTSVTIDGLFFNSAQPYTIAAATGQQLNLDSTPFISITTGTGAHEISAPIQLLSPLTIDQETAVNFTISGVISGSETISISTTGNVIFSGNNNTYSGSTTLSTGTLTLGHSNGLGSASLTMQPATTLALNSSVVAPNNIVLAGLASATMQVSSGTGELGGQISGTGGLEKTGAGTLTLSGGSITDYSGNTTLTLGVLQAGAANSFSSSSAVTLANTGGVALDLNGYNNTILRLIGGGSTGGDVLLNAGGTLTVGDAMSTAYGGSLSGSGGLTKQGGGTLTLNGTSNDYSGTTTINEGVLQAGMASSFSSNSVVALANTAGAELDLNGVNNTIAGLSGGGMAGGDVSLGIGTLTISNSSDFPYYGTIGGPGNLIKEGSGTQTLGGTNSYTGTTTINAGKISITGSITGDVTVNDSGSLGGNGTIGGNVIIASGGTLVPGASIGVLTIDSDLTLNAASNTIIELNPSLSSRIDVGGMATLAGTLTLIAQGGTYALTRDYTILQATGGVIGTFDSIVNPSGFTSQITYEANSVLLTLIKIMLSTNNLSGNEKRTAEYLNAISPLSDSIISSLSALSTDEYKRALDSISPARLAITTFSSQNTLFSVGQFGLDRISFRREQERRKEITNIDFQEETLLVMNPRKNLSLPRGSVVQMGKKENDYDMWLQGIGEWTRQDSQEQTPGFNVTSGGGLLGADYFGAEGTVGAAAGFIQSSISQDRNSGSASVQFYLLGCYGEYYIENFYLDFGLWGAFNAYKNKRHIFFTGVDATARSSHKGWQLMPLFGLGYDIALQPLTLEPFATVEWACNFEKSFSEKGAGIFDMRVKSKYSSMLRSEIGLNLYQNREQNGHLLIVKEKISYINKQPFDTGVVDAALTIAPTGYTVESFRRQNLASIELEGFFRAGNGFFFTLLYQGEFGTNYIFNETAGKIGWFF